MSHAMEMDYPTTVQTPAVASTSRTTLDDLQSIFSDVLQYRTPTPPPIISTSHRPPAPTTPSSPTRGRRRNSTVKARPSPADPSTASRRAPYPLELDLLLEAGTILLPNYAPADPAANDDWQPLTHTSLIYTAEDINAPPTPPPSPQKGSRASTILMSPPELLHHVLVLQDALRLRATHRRGVLRVYLVPRDLAEMALKEVFKTKRSDPAAANAVGVLSVIRQSADEWNGKGETDEEVKLMLDDRDHRSLLEIYRALPSPPDDPEFYLNLPEASDAVKEALCDALSDSPLGFSTELYPYQRASVAKMLARELAPQLVRDPSYLPCTALNGRVFYVSVDGRVLRNPPLFREPTGGILAENMGSGKTAISLALIVSTLHSLPNLAGVSAYLDGSRSPPPVLMTPLSELWPFAAYTAERARLRPRIPAPLDGCDLNAKEYQEYDRARAEQNAADALVPQAPIPSLVDICLTRLRTTSGRGYEATDWGMAAELEGLALHEYLAASNHLESLRRAPFYFVHPSPVQLETRRGREGGFKASKIFVSAATLVVVPGDLIPQWRGEIEKHVDPAAGLRTLVLKTVRDELPDPEHLTVFDLVLMSVSRFSKEAEEAHSALKRVHWKRLLVDEGHALASTNKMQTLAEELRTECSWMISGTPTKNLRGDHEGALLSGASTAAGDKTDFDRLGRIFSRFLKHSAFPLLPKPGRWHHVITEPSLREGGMSRLVGVLAQALVRNEPHRIAQAYILPPLTSRIIYLDLNAAELKMYNALLAVFTSNSVLSQRVDQDYIFAPKQKKALDELTLNLAASTFFFSSEGVTANAVESIKNSRNGLNSEKSATWSDKDRAALSEAAERMEAMLSDAEWQQRAGSITVGIEVENLQPELLRFFDGLEAARNPRGVNLLPLGQLVTFRRNLLELRKTETPAWASDEDLVEEMITFEMKRRREMNAPPPLASVPQEAKPKHKRKRGEPVVLHPLPNNSNFKQIALGGTSSAKLNYCVAEVRKYPSEKFIIFCSSLPDLVFANLSEAFDLLSIPHLIFAGHSRNKDRGATAAKFNSTSAEEYRAILVDARLGGRGLNLTAASRILMLEPIWLPDLEIQAAKRAHRLGQTKPVDLQVLVIRDSYEDAMLKRRGQLSQSDFAKTKQPQGDEQLRHLLQSAKYLERVADRPVEVVWTPLLAPHRSTKDMETRETREVDVSVVLDKEKGHVRDESKEGDSLVVPPLKKQKLSVRFAED